MKRAIIDIGTNSVLMLIGRQNGDRIEPMMEKFNVTRLGKDVQHTNQLSQSAVERTMDILGEYHRDITEAGIDDVHVLGTESLRVAENGADFKNLLLSEYGWDLRILTGEEEAYYSYLGAVDLIADNGSPTIVVDVGGGSTEIIIGKQNLVSFKQSYPVGVVKLAEKFNMKPKLSGKDRNDILQSIHDTIGNVSIPANAQLIGSGGTISTLAAIKEQMYIYNPEIINGYVLNITDLSDLYTMLNQMSISKRRKLPGLVPGRADVILYGILIYFTLMQEYGYKKITASDRGWRFGWFYHLENN